MNLKFTSLRPLLTTGPLPAERKPVVAPQSCAAMGHGDTTHLGSATKLIKVGGELMAVSHEVPKTGYKSENAYGAKSVFIGETTKGFYDK